MLLHSRERHVKLLGKIRDRRVSTSELLKNAASRGVGKRGERGIEGGGGMLNHVVQYTRGPPAAPAFLSSVVRSDSRSARAEMKAAGASKNATNVKWLPRVVLVSNTLRSSVSGEGL